jgi:hypothetical protein
MPVLKSARVVTPPRHIRLIQKQKHSYDPNHSLSDVDCFPPVLKTNTGNELFP